MVYLRTLFLLALSPVVLFGQREEGSIPTVIPRPALVEVKSGGDFTFNDETRFVALLDSQRMALQTLIGALRIPEQQQPRIDDIAPAGNFVLLGEDATLAPEHYRLSVDSEHIKITAASYAGWLYGLQTLRQLLPPGIEKASGKAIDWSVPSLSITDGPEFAWRGLMLDVARHFFSKEYILATIDRMALLKLNVLHLHLVDDQGWRIEIKQYPKLTEVGAWRVDQEDRHWDAREKNTPDQEATYGGFYTQEDIREIVAYATRNAIRVIPEIEMPAHVMSALAAYPEYSCVKEPIAVPSGGVWPITDIYCPGKEATFTFLENILGEVMELFPDRYIHVGGDEATKTNWKACPDCQHRMKEEGLEDVEELQSYFIRRMERFLSSHGKTLIGWDEILEGGLAEGATVMSWRGTAGGIEASKMGHDVVMTPGDYVYLNQYQGEPDYEPLAFGGYVPLSKVYAFDPLDGIEDERQARHILGGQGNLWSEFITKADMSEYMLYPRLAALSESLWTSRDRKSWTDFSAGMPRFFERLDALDIHYSRSAYAVTAKSEVDPDGQGIEMSLSTEFPKVDIHYTLDGSTPTAESLKFKKPLLLDSTTTIAAATFLNGDAAGAVLTKTFNFHLAVGKSVSYQPSYSKQYPGQGEVGLVNVFRGSKNFHDGQWQAWLNEDVEVDIDLLDTLTIRSVSVGTMENQGSGIYFPTEVEVLISDDGTNFHSVGATSRRYAANGLPLLEEFIVGFPPLSARYLRVEVRNLGSGPMGGGSWMFIDEVIVR